MQRGLRGAPVDFRQRVLKQLNGRQDLKQDPSVLGLDGLGISPAIPFSQVSKAHKLLRACGTQKVHSPPHLHAQNTIIFELLC